MRLLAPISALLLLAGVSTGLLAMQRGGNQSYDEYGAREAFSSSGNDNGKNEYSWSRLRYSMAGANGAGYGYGRYATWSRDYPKADRQFLIALKRLTRINARPASRWWTSIAEGPDEHRQFPWVYAVQVQTWTFTDAEAKRLREYLLKGGFLMVDDFHGTDRLGAFHGRHAHGVPGPAHRGSEDNDEIFHVLYDLDDRFQVPGRAVRQHRPNL